MNKSLKVLANRKSYNNAVNMAIIKKPIWFNNTKRFGNKCTICGDHHYWTSNHLYYYTNEAKDNRHYLFCEPCAYDIELSIESYHLCYHVLKYILDRILTNDISQYIHIIYIKLYVDIPKIPEYILISIRECDAILSIFNSIKELTNNNLILLANVFNIKYKKNEEYDVWELIKYLCLYKDEITNKRQKELYKMQGIFG
jgi:hypothetical protein